MKIKSSHDALNDPKLSSVPALETRPTEDVSHFKCFMLCPSYEGSMFVFLKLGYHLPREHRFIKLRSETNIELP